MCFQCEQLLLVGAQMGGAIENMGDEAWLA